MNVIEYTHEECRALLLHAQLLELQLAALALEDPDLAADLVERGYISDGDLEAARILRAEAVAA